MWIGTLKWSAQSEVAMHGTEMKFKGCQGNEGQQSETPVPEAARQTFRCPEHSGALSKGEWGQDCGSCHITFQNPTVSSNS